jgi:UDP-N-acetylmuramate dehydrogenase
LKQLFPQAEFNVSVAPYTTFGIGGEAAAILIVKEPAELTAAISLARANKISYRLIAGGSNVVFSDKIFQGLLIIFCDGGTSKLDHTCHCQGVALTVNASAPLSELIKGAIKNNLAGLEALSGIPGTVGGAIVGNAGAYGQSISDHLVAVEVWDGKKTKWLEKKACKFNYRDSIFKHKNLVILRAKFKLESGDKKALVKKSREIIKTRNKKYAPGLRCPGSFFKNIVQPDGSKIPAGKLLEAVGAKGMRVGGIYVADFHGNLLINDGQGTYADVKKLASKLKQKVLKKFGIKLEEEVRYIDGI